MGNRDAGTKQYSPSWQFEVTADTYQAQNYV